MEKIFNLEKRFKEQRHYNPYWSDYLCFAESIKGRRINQAVVRRCFNKLVDKNDYEKVDKQQIITFLLTLLSKEKISGRGNIKNLRVREKE